MYISIRRDVWLLLTIHRGSLLRDPYKPHGILSWGPLVSTTTTLWQAACGKLVKLEGMFESVAYPGPWIYLEVL